MDFIDSIAIKTNPYQGLKRYTQYARCEKCRIAIKTNPYQGLKLRCESVRNAFTQLRHVSQNHHLPAFQRCVGEFN